MNIAVATDRNYSPSEDKQVADAVCAKLRAAGHTVTYAGRGPNVIQIYAQSHPLDLMVQIGGGMCIGTLCDFSYGIKRGYYKAKKATCVYYIKHWTKLHPETWVSHTASDDRFSVGIPESFRSTFGWGKKLPEVYAMHDNIGPFCYGKSGEEIGECLVRKINGGDSATTGGNTGGGGGGGQTILDLIKQVITPWDKYGIAMGIWNGYLYIYRAKTTGTTNTELQSFITEKVPTITDKLVVNDSITITDYASNTPNYLKVGNHEIKNDALIKRFGKIPVKDEVQNKGKSWVQDMYQVSQRESGHTIDMTILYTGGVVTGQYVYVNLESIGLKGFYFVTKRSMEENLMNMSITLEPAPPSRYTEQTESTEITDSGTGSGLGKDAVSIGKALAAKYGFCSKVKCPAGGSPTESSEEMKRTGRGSCFAWSDALYTELNAAGIKARIIQYRTVYAGNHRSVQILQNGNWVDYPYAEAGINVYARATTNKPGMFVQRQPP